MYVLASNLYGLNRETADRFNRKPPTRQVSRKTQNSKSIIYKNGEYSESISLNIKDIFQSGPKTTPKAFRLACKKALLGQEIVLDRNKTSIKVKGNKVLLRLLTSAQLQVLYKSKDPICFYEGDTTSQHRSIRCQGDRGQAGKIQFGLNSAPQDFIDDCTAALKKNNIFLYSPEVKINDKRVPFEEFNTEDLEKLCQLKSPHIYIYSNRADTDTNTMRIRYYHKIFKTPYTIRIPCGPETDPMDFVEEVKREVANKVDITLSNRAKIQIGTKDVLLNKLTVTDIKTLTSQYYILISITDPWSGWNRRAVPVSAPLPVSKKIFSELTGESVDSIVVGSTVKTSSETFICVE